MASKTSKKYEITTYFGRCRCCLNYGYLKSIWNKHKWNGDIEIYGNMIFECFALTLDSPKVQSRICDTCIKRLRDACLFKKQIQDAQDEQIATADDEGLFNSDEVLNILYGEDHDNSQNGDTDSQIYYSDSKIDYNNSLNDNDGSQIEYYNSQFDDDFDDSSDDAKEQDTKDFDTETYEEVEYLDDEIILGDNEDLDGQKDAASASVSRRRGKSKKNPNAKWPAKLPKASRNKTYKQYEQKDLQDAIKLVVNGDMTILNAAKKFHVPYKTLKFKVQQSKIDPKPTVKNEQHAEFIKEIKTVLSYTNVTPYKCKAVRYKCKEVRYYCSFCTIDGPSFDPEELRIHTRTHHAKDKIDKVPEILRPAWLNEILKVDIDNLVCTKCSCGIDNWNEMFKHLKKIHNIELDQAYTRIVPYILKPELECALCFGKFMNYILLDGHMNSHYNNYVCDDCGDPFLTNTRLKQHRLIHLAGRFPCEVCGKNFSLAKYRKKHMDVHNKEMKHKCYYCPEKLETVHKRHVHMAEKHKEKLKIYSCDHCGKTFNYRLYYLKHLKNAYTRKRYDCSVCNKQFLYKYDLKKHLASEHKGTR